MDGVRPHVDRPKSTFDLRNPHFYGLPYGPLDTEKYPTSISADSIGKYSIVALRPAPTSIGGNGVHQSG
jgi:hypothetical protein